ncbi:MAG: hypothetical protein JXX14_06550, partial [Deltaproteobacteria bacterium]|nr:hypothetical protein [Deltaproteobacteria bacterium]
IQELHLGARPCVLMTDGTFHCWSDILAGFEQVPINDVLSHVVNAGQWGWCGIRKFDGIEVCWGNINRNHWE